MKLPPRSSRALACQLCRVKAYKNLAVQSGVPASSRRLLTAATAETRQVEKSPLLIYDHSAVQRRHGTPSAATQALHRDPPKREDPNTKAHAVRAAAGRSLDGKGTTRSRKAQENVQQIGVGNRKPVPDQKRISTPSPGDNNNLIKLPHERLLKLFAIICDKFDADDVQQSYRSMPESSSRSFGNFVRDCEQTGVLKWQGLDTLKNAMLNGLVKAWGNRKTSDALVDLRAFRRDNLASKLSDPRSVALVHDLVEKQAFDKATEIIAKHAQSKTTTYQDNDQDDKAVSPHQRDSRGEVIDAQSPSQLNSRTGRSIQSSEAVPETRERQRGRHDSKTVRNGPSTVPAGTTFTSLDSSILTVSPLESDQPPIPSLAHDLQRVLFNPGIYQLQDPRSRVYNFDPYLKSIMPVTEFDFSALSEYITSSKDDTLLQLARDRGRKYLGSSSSMTSVLSQFHFLLSRWRDVTTSMMSRGFPDTFTQVSHLSKAPAAVMLRHKDGVYAIDADKEFDRQTILSVLGKSMEKLLTSSKEVYEQYRRSDEQAPFVLEKPSRESYHYSELGDFLMRAQLDAKDPRLPGTGVFDLKTRAVVSVRMDALNYQEGLGYQIKDRYGEFESYEREFFDMIRSAFLKYSLQVRMGRMDGIFVTYHNVESIFGFQYIGLPELDFAIHGQTDTALGDQEFRLSLGLWNDVLDRVTHKFPGRSIRLHFETRPSKIQTFMYVFAEPIDDQQIEEMDAEKEHAWEGFLADLRKRDTADLKPQHSDAESPRALWDDALAHEEDAGEDDMTSENDTTDIAAAQGGDTMETAPRELLAFVITVENHVNKARVIRPKNLKSTDNWTVDCKITEVNSPRSSALYENCQKRRKAQFTPEERENKYMGGYLKRLRGLSETGRRWQQWHNKQASTQPPVVLYGKGDAVQEY